MPYDRALADRVRAALADQPCATEKPMLVAPDAALEEWIERGVAHARSAPP